MSTRLMNARLGDFVAAARFAAVDTKTCADGAVYTGTPILTDWQQRVIAEKADIDAKLANLIPFLSSDTCHGLPFAERSRLKRQADVMGEYSDILAERIAAFAGGESV